MGNNYTVTLANNDEQDSSAMTWQALQTIDFTFNTPFTLALIDEQIFFADSVARIMPKKRVVVFGTWQDKPAVAKIFFDAHHAKRHMEADLAGVEKLQENKVPTARLYYRGICKDQRIYILIFEQIFAAKNLADIWNNRKSADGLFPLMQALMIELATQHVVGILQHDLHLNNFLMTRKKVYTLDGSHIELFPPLLAKKASMNNLALFLSQLGVGLENFQERLFNAYAKARGWLLKKEDTDELFLMIEKWNQTRWQQYEKKIFRNCTSFAAVKKWDTFFVYDRHYALPEFMQFLQNPETIFQHPTAKILKAGRSATVVKVVLDQREMVVKRYNLKNFWHRLRRSLRDTRAAWSWRLANKLNLFGVATAKPIAFIEKRCFALRGQSYYVMDYVNEENLGEFFSRHAKEDEKTITMIDQTAQLLKNITQLKITHGDLKITNILVDRHQKPLLIDLDGAKEHHSLTSLRGAWKREMKRFLRNFSAQPDLQKKFKSALKKK